MAYSRKKVAVVEGDRFVPLAELEVRLGRSRGDIYKQYRNDPTFLELVQSGGRTGALDSKVRAYLASLPKLKKSPAREAEHA